MMKTITSILFFIISIGIFSQQIDENIIEVTGLRKFKTDSCNCKSVKKTSHNYRFFGLIQNTQVRIKHYKNQILVNNNGYSITYDTSNNFIRYLVNSKTIKYKLDTIIHVFFNLNNPGGKKGGQADYNAKLYFKDGLLIQKDRDYANDDYIGSIFYVYDSNNIKVFNKYRYKKNRRLVYEFIYDSKKNNTHYIIYDSYEKENDTTFLNRYFYNNKNQLIKEKTIEYSFLEYLVIYDYNERGLVTKETYFNGKNKWDGSYEIIYNNKSQIKEVYQLNRRGKRKRLVTKYEYEY